MHAGEVGVFYRCNRFVAAEEASALARFGGGGLGLLSLLGGIVGRIQVASSFVCLRQGKGSLLEDRPNRCAYPRLTCIK